MKQSIGLFLAIGMCCLLMGVSRSATIIVPTNQPTVAAAIAAAVSGDTILINAGTYAEDTFNVIDKALVIKGNGGQAIMTLKANVSANTATDVSNSAQVVMTPSFPGTVMNVTLENLTFLPTTTDVSGTRANKGLEFIAITAGAGTTMQLTVNNCLVCPNNGSNAPVTTDGLTFANVSTSGAVTFRDDGIVLRGRINSTFNNVISSNNRPTSSSPDGFVLVPTSGGGYTTNFNGCISSFNDRIGVQVASGGDVFNFVGTDTSRNKFIANGVFNTGNADIAILVSALNSSNPGIVNVSYSDFSSGLATGLLTALATPAQGLPLNISNCRFISSVISTRNCIELDHSIAFAQGTIMNCTFLSGLSTNYDLNVAISTNTTNLYVSGCIFSNVAGTNGKGVNNDGTAAVINISNSSLVTAGANALSVTTSGAGVIALNSIINSDPQFLQTNNWLSSDYLDVTNYAYGAAGVASSVLKGGAHYFGVTPIADAAHVSATRTFDITGGIGPYSTWTSDNNAVATVSSTANNVAFVNTLSLGTANITVKDLLSRTATKAIITVTATNAPMANDPQVSSAIINTREIKMP